MVLEYVVGVFHVVSIAFVIMDAWTNAGLRDTAKIFWTGIVVIFGLLAGIVYFFTVFLREQTHKQVAAENFFDLSDDPKVDRFYD